MPDLNTIVQRMIDAGEPEEAIGGVIREFHKTNPPKPTQPPKPAAQEVIGEPDNFFEGFSKSIFSGEALKAGLKGAGGFLKGAIADIPSSIMEGGDAIAKGLDSLATNPVAHFKAAPQAFREMGHGIAETTRHAGSDPEAFGRMVGQFTGQPLVAEGALAGSGMVGRAGRLPAAKILEPVGRLLEGSKPTAGFPITPKGAIARGIGKVAEPVGRSLRQTGENLRLKAHNVESANDFAARAPQADPGPQNEWTDLFNQFDQRQGQAENQPAILETTQDLAARGGGTNPANPFVNEPPVDIDPMFRSPATPPEGRLVPAQTLSPEEEMAAAVQEVRDSFARQNEPGVELPPPDYSLGSNAPPQQPRVNVASAKTKPVKGGTKEPVKAKQTSETPVDKTTGEITEPTNISPETEAAFKEIFENLENKPSVPKLKRVGGKWQIVKDIFKSGNDAGSATIPSWAERVAAKLGGDSEAFDVGSIDGPIDLNRAVRELDAPKRPPISNRQMFQLSEQRGAENRASKSPGREFAQSVLPSEFAEDMMLTPGELRNPDIPKMHSPVENQFDQRMAPGGVVSDSTPASKKSSFMDRVNQFVRDESGEFDPDALKGKPDKTMPKSDAKKSLFKQKVNKDFAEASKPKALGAPRLVKEETPETLTPKDEAPQLVTRTGDKVKPVGRRGHTFKVTAPDGKHLGDITISPDEVTEVIEKYPELSGLTAEQITQSMYESQLSDILQKHGYSENDIPRMKVDKADNRKKPTPVTELAGEPTFSTDKTTVNPEEAFGEGGDIQQVIEEATRLGKTKGPDTKFKQLLPKGMQYDLKSGETYEGRLGDLINTLRSVDDPGLIEQAVKRMEERDEFLKSVRQEPDIVSKEPNLILRNLKPGDFRTPLTGRLRGLISGERKPVTWESPKPKRKGSES